MILIISEVQILYLVRTAQESSISVKHVKMAIYRYHSGIIVKPIHHLALFARVSIYSREGTWLLHTSHIVFLSEVANELDINCILKTFFVIINSIRYFSSILKKIPQSTQKTRAVVMYDENQKRCLEIEILMKILWFSVYRTTSKI